MKQKIKKVITVMSTMTLTLLAGIVAYGDEKENEIANQVLQPINVLKTIFIAIIGAVGVFIIGKGVIDLAVGIKQRDSSALVEAILELAGGAIVMAVDLIVGIFAL